MRAIEALRAIANEPSKTAKISLVKDALRDDTFKTAMKYALNPFITFGIKKLPTPTRSGIYFVDSTSFDLLDRLAQRKVTGNAAADAVQTHLEGLGPQEQDLFTRIILKDLRAGFTRNTVNKASPALIPTFDCMLAHKYEKHRGKIVYPVAVEPKVDGVRVLAFVDDEEVTFYSRGGKEFTTFDHLKEPLRELGYLFDYPVVVDGEIMSGVFNKTVGDVHRKDTQAVDATFYAFDILDSALFSQPKGNSSKELYAERRLATVEAITKIGDDRLTYLPSMPANDHEQVLALYREFRAAGYEGAMVKLLDAPYARKRSNGWLKIKDCLSADLRVTALEEGEGKNVGKLGALVVDYNGVSVKVGTGLDDEQRASFWASQEDVVGRLIEVEYQEETPDGSLRHPVFVRFRDDKDTSGV